MTQPDRARASVLDRQLCFVPWAASRAMTSCCRNADVVALRADPQALACRLRDAAGR